MEKNSQIHLIQNIQIKNLAFSKNINIIVIMDLEKELRIIVGSNDILSFLCKKRRKFYRELVSEG